MSARKLTCGTCACWCVKQKDGPTVADHWGYCRRHAPLINDEALRRIAVIEGTSDEPEMPFGHLQLASLWPVTAGAMGCEEHVRAASMTFRPITSAHVGEGC